MSVPPWVSLCWLHSRDAQDDPGQPARLPFPPPLPQRQVELAAVASSPCRWLVLAQVTSFKTHFLTSENKILDRKQTLGFRESSEGQATWPSPSGAEAAGGQPPRTTGLPAGHSSGGDIQVRRAWGTRHRGRRQAGLAVFSTPHTREEALTEGTLRSDGG